MEGIEDYHFGQTYTKKIEPEDAHKFATIFGEGSPALTELIEYCILNHITTIASCKGHPEKTNLLDRVLETGYITFSFGMEYDREFACFLASIPLIKKEIRAHLECFCPTGRTITLNVPARRKDMSEKYFRYILELLKEYKRMKAEGKEIPINPDIDQIVEYLFWQYRNDEVFEITHRGFEKYERKGIYLKRTKKCPAHERTGILHRKFGKALSRSQRIEEFIGDFTKNLK